LILLAFLCLEHLHDTQCFKWKTGRRIISRIVIVILIYHRHKPIDSIRSRWLLNIRLNLCRISENVLSLRVQNQFATDAVRFLIYTNSVASVRELTIPTERPPPVGEVCVNFCGWSVPRGQRDGSLRPYSRLSRPFLFIRLRINEHLIFSGYYFNITTIV
jgi:hypothetical protein